MRRIRTETLAGEYSHIDIEDAAIDREAPKWEDGYARAMETGDIGHVPLRNGTSDPPTIWRFRHLTTSQKAWLGDHPSHGIGTRETMLQARQLALVGVQNVVDDPNRPIAVDRVRLPAMRDWQGVSEDQVNTLLGGDVNLMLRLGVRIMKDDVPPNG